MYIFTTQMLDFIKKYPMSILLAIIALNLFSIAGSLSKEAKLNQMKLDCAKWKLGHGVDLIQKYLGDKGGATSYDAWCSRYL